MSFHVSIPLTEGTNESVLTLPSFDYECGHPARDHATTYQQQKYYPNTNKADCATVDTVTKNPAVPNHAPTQVGGHDGEAGSMSEDALMEVAFTAQRILKAWSDARRSPWGAPELHNVLTSLLDKYASYRPSKTSLPGTANDDPIEWTMDGEFYCSTSAQEPLRRQIVRDLIEDLSLSIIEERLDTLDTKENLALAKGILRGKRVTNLEDSLCNK
ncbi:hypothetical protein BZG36_02649 [Bifiguratus adelaidae]|uniref:Uncharacterized protein n=1 Tax=Bifiguratus adelaidae TaxID=1938954 RepID=A0A261Y2V0_9FUNG|nr:hypothetical protein BZG36_02649 [Bifiguratus adelaidae]